MTEAQATQEHLIRELGEFLRSRRDRLAPADVGVRAYGRRRVPGLRREELAQLAGVSVAYYTRLEQGQSQNASDSVIESLARALRLDEDEWTHLFDLARPTPSKRKQAQRHERASVKSVQLLNAMGDIPALLLGRRNDILAWNHAGHLLMASHLSFDEPALLDQRPNLLRLLFLDPHTRELHRSWRDEAALAVDSLRYVAAQFPDDRGLAQVIGELSLGSQDFARLWARRTVRLCSSGTKALHHPEVGDLDLDYEVLHLAGGEGQRIVTHTAPPGSSSAAALRLLVRGPLGR
ncbi:MAG: helix-turn-helix transcriptional regulator [Dermatophilaceae bacterium]